MKRFFLFLAALVLLVGCAAESTPSEDLSRPSLGSLESPVQIEEFSDLQCPACALVGPQVEKIVRENPTLAHLTYFHFPLPQHAFAFRAAEASECARDQGKFWEYVNAVFAHQPALNEETLLELSGTLSLDENRFQACLTGRTHKDRVLSDLSDGRKRRVSATPTFFVNGKDVRFKDSESFKMYLESLSL